MTDKEKNILETFGQLTLEVNKLPSINYSYDLISKYEGIFLEGDTGLIIASQKIQELERIFSSAKFALVKGSHDKHQGVSGDDAQTVIRFEFLKNAIIWYNSCYDYILQIVYFGFDFNKPISCRSEYLKELKNCRYIKNQKTSKTFYTEFEKIALKNPDAQDLFERLNTFYFENKGKLRDWANKLKHQGGIELDILYTKPLSYGFRNEDCNKDCKELFSDYYIIPTIISLDEVIKEVIRVHIEIVQIVDYLYNFIGFKDIEVTNILNVNNKHIFKKFSVKTDNNATR